MDTSKQRERGSVPLHRSCLRPPSGKFFHLNAPAPKVLGVSWDPPPSRWPPEGSMLLHRSSQAVGNVIQLTANRTQ
ncbi:MAG: hypothetical protein LBQ54_05365 [Planctomycetaceae bacterium]|nr:hypothetical protein [Planctomycetaceae bacterium]